MRLLACRTFATLALASPSSSRWQGLGPSVVRSLSTTTSPSATLDSDSEKQLRSIAGSTTSSPTATNTEASPAVTNSVQSAKPSAAAPRRPGSSAEEAPSHEHGKRSLLEPYELSRRLITLCQSGDVDLAVTTLRSAPRNAQNVKVWNTLIKQCMDAKKYKLAYSVFTDVCPTRHSSCHFRHIPPFVCHRIGAKLVDWSCFYR